MTPVIVIGSAGFGTRTSDVFIENGLVHAGRALDDIARKLVPGRRQRAGA